MQLLVFSGFTTAYVCGRKAARRQYCIRGGHASSRWRSVVSQLKSGNLSLTATKLTPRRRIRLVVARAGVSAHRSPFAVFTPPVRQQPTSVRTKRSTAAPQKRSFDCAVGKWKRWRTSWRAGRSWTRRRPVCCWLRSHRLTSWGGDRTLASTRSNMEWAENVPGSRESRSIDARKLSMCRSRTFSSCLMSWPFSNAAIAELTSCLPHCQVCFFRSQSFCELLSRFHFWQSSSWAFLSSDKISFVCLIMSSLRLVDYLSPLSHGLARFILFLYY